MASKITKGILISCWIVYLAILGAVVMVFMAIANGSIGYMPPVEQLENPIDKYASQVISSDHRFPWVLPVYVLKVKGSLYSYPLRQF